MKKINLKNQDGISVLLAVLVISGVVLMLSLTYSIISIDETGLGLKHSKAMHTSTITDACVDQALYELNRDHNYNGELLTIEGVSCTISVSGSGDDRTINIYADYNEDLVKEVNVGVNWSDSFKIVSWQNVID